MKIVCYGDSNTYGFDPRAGTPGRLPKEERWTGILDAMPEYEIVNEGMNGRMIPDGDGGFQNLSRIVRRNMDADALVIMLGTNDMFMLKGATANMLGDRMRNMFQNVPELREFGERPDKRIFLLCPPSPSTNVLFFQMIGLSAAQTAGEISKVMEELPSEYAEVAEEEGAYFIDASNWPIALMYDGLHFSEEGHKVFAERMAEELRKGA
ncbi:MAG: GDSL-type esterase/lipase family protein [Lachnospiraceae bacterium]|nr:GDSL-type esterase/lipase family protein [Lachnospiraceae bacterium]